MIRYKREIIRIHPNENTPEYAVSDLEACLYDAHRSHARTQHVYLCGAVLLCTDPIHVLKVAEIQRAHLTYITQQCLCLSKKSTDPDFFVN